jgi:hypothetical protein
MIPTGASRGVAPLLVLCTSACDDKIPTDPLASVLPGLTIAASTSGGNVTFLSATVAFTNTTAETIELLHPAGCPVRLQFFPRNSTVPVFNEHDVPCEVDHVVTLTIPPQTTRNLTSGFRNPNSILGDSIPPGWYDASVVVRITGGFPFDLPAGSLQLAPIPTGQGPATRSPWR